MLKNAISRRQMPKDVCVPYDKLENLFDGVLSSGSSNACNNWTNDNESTCKKDYYGNVEQGCGLKWDSSTKRCTVTGGCCWDGINRISKTQEIQCDAKAGYKWNQANNKCGCAEGYIPYSNGCILEAEHKCISGGGIWNVYLEYCICQDDAKEYDESSFKCIVKP